MEIIVHVLVRAVLRKGAEDETSVFGYLLMLQIVAIIAVVGVCGWSAFSRPW